mmetsp:Transcript_17410/g.28907  ORF Transcript_17410/g.28907 Transcript_17410/m.28907 type:complete len:326 (-) Transcript_17410:173-1150(-)
MLQKPSCNSVTSLVVGNDRSLFLAHNLVGFQTTNDAINRGVKICHLYRISLATSCNNRCFIANIGNVRSSKAWCQSSQATSNVLTISLKGNSPEMNQKDFFASLQVRLINLNGTIKATWSSERLIQDIGTICTCQHHYSGTRRKSIHLHQQLIQSILTFVVTTHAPTTTLTTNGINLVDKDNTRCIGTRFLEQVTDATRSDTDKHFNKVGTRHAVEWNAGFTSHSLGQQCLSRTGRSAQQGTLGNLGTQFGKLFGFLQKIHKLHNFLLGFVTPRHVGKGSRHFFLAHLFSCRFAHFKHATHATRTTSSSTHSGTTQHGKEDTHEQ